MTGIDNSSKMLKIALNKNKETDTRFLFHDASTPLPFNDDKFDFSIASYVAHGLSAKERSKMLIEMRRVSKHYVILHDYGKERKLTTDIIESLEGGNYFDFIKNIEHELDSVFNDISIVPVGKNALWYICKV
jgi:ubiquinone/menaquinone biosynthesis C-methylase UbiE